jgi:hypothetical protein
MPDMRYFHREEKFLRESWDVYSSYFSRQEDFEKQYRQIDSDLRKNLFLKISSFYKFLVRDGEFLVEINDQKHPISYIDSTYKFVALTSFIEALYSRRGYVDFYEWLVQKKQRSITFPIQNAAEFETLYKDYKRAHGLTNKVVRFFSNLDRKSQDFLTARITSNGKHFSIEELAQFLYQLRSDFVHSARLILEFQEGTMISKRKDRRIESIVSFADVALLFEDGLLQNFGFSVEKRPI